MLTRSFFLKILSGALIFGAWEYAGRTGVNYALPTFLESMKALFDMTMSGLIFEAYADTLRPLAVGVFISSFIGIGIGVWVGLSEKFDWLVSPIFIIMQAAPLAALIPLLIMAYGIGLTSKVFVVCIMAMPVIVLNTSVAMARSFLGTEKDVILKIIIPAASPVIFAGLRLGVSAGFIGAILAELKITPTGVGDIISYSRMTADYPSMYAAIFSIILLAVLFLNLLEKIENFFFKGNNQGYIS